MRKLTFITLSIVLIFGACRDNVDIFSPDPQGALFSASAFVEVFDDEGAPVEDAFVRLGNATATTNAIGLARLQSVNMTSQSYVTVTKTGYFHGSRRFYPTAHKTHHLRIQLLPADPVGSFNANTGAEIEISGGSTLTFPANAISDEDGNPYTGVVEVAAQPIYADDAALSEKMPGDLIGRSTAGENGSLSSLGMLAVELSSPSGDKLQVSEGATVEMKMPVPPSMQATAPALIPMWYFDELRGIWIEEGEAQLVGDTYIANVAHFTYWNYDAWFPIVKWGTTILLPNGEPASNVSVCITILQMNTTKCSYTNSAGMVCGMVPSNQELLLEIGNPCNETLYSETIGPFTDSTMTPPITLSGLSTVTTSISGVAVNCDSDPVTDGYVVLTVGNKNYFDILDEENGSFSLEFINCDESDFTLVVFDESALKQSLPLTFSHAETINAGTISVCENLEEYLQVEGDNGSAFYFDLTASASQGWTTIYAVNPDTNQYLYLSIQGIGTGTYGPESVLAEVGFENDLGEAGYLVDLEVVITYYGEVGDFITGTLTGVFNPNQTGGTGFPVTGDFSVLRE